MAWDWKKTAALAKAKLLTARHGAKEAALKEAGGAVDVNTVRRAVSALDFLEELKDSRPESYGILKDSSFAVVETLSRWWPFDPDAAAAAVQRWKEGSLTTRGLDEAMRKSRPPLVDSAEGESLPRTFRDYAEPFVRRAIEEAVGCAVSPIKDKGPRHLPVDFRYQIDGERRAVAILVGPYQNHTIYRKRKHDWMLRALGLAYFSDLVFIVVPDRSVAEDYAEWIELAGREGDLAVRRSWFDPLIRLRVLAVE
jgi:hypothetical protein